MVIIFASMLYERRIIITSRRVSRLSACVQAANLLLWPMQWQHIFIPVLPQHLIDYLLAPMPFLIGVATGLLTKVQMEDVGEAVILDADANTVTSPFEDIASLPPEVTSTLRRHLRSAHNTMGDGVARAFLRALVTLIGNYKEALQFREDDKKITFCRERFVSLRPLHMQAFAEKLLQLQIFQQFIEERLQKLNSGKQTSDDFELEVSLLGERSGSKVKQQYRQFVTSVRKDGGAIIKTMKSKSPFKHLRTADPPTNPAVKSAVKSVTKGSKQVKEKGRQTYKEFRGRLRDLHQLRDDPRTSPPSWVNGDGMQKKPRSAPTSPTSTRRPRSAVGGGGAGGFVVKTTYKRSTQGGVREDR
ncbi:DENN domain-containing protein 1A-like [Portunus trituberculatus]|uniref:DENN domain-containing protein 1A-like n=1 Tax=Portunus trituberculatus TaxID=210409 RepID=UPI001E1D1154|nr:DENN domain-containing protein 1A-like [Portunus trituberculatus]